MKTLRVGIASYEKMKARTMAIARGEHKVTKDEPKVWFTSAESFAKVLSDKNRTLLELIAKTEPESLSELVKKTGRKKSNLSRTLHTMENYGLVVFKKAEKGRLVPRVYYTNIALLVQIGSIQ